MIIKPDINKISQIVPEASNLEEIGVGGFKIVYKALVNNKNEAVKLVLIPSDENDPNVRDENLSRIIREIDILAKCTSPYLVKLGSIVPRPCEIDGNEYVIYSEEYIPGTNLRQMIQSDYKPQKKELVEVAVCLLEGIRELSGLNGEHYRFVNESHISM